MGQQSIAHYYEQDHARLGGLFERFRTTKRSNQTAAGQAFRQFADGLKRHIVWEEAILFPLFEAKTGVHGMGPTAVMRMEHQQIRALLDAILLKVEHQDAAGDAEENALLEVLDAHNRKEEHMLYPLIDQHLSDEERQGVFTKMDQIGGDGRTPCGATC